MAAFTYSTQGTQEKKTAAKLEKLSKENPEVAESLLKTVNVPTTGPPNRSQWRKLELAMKFINKSKAEADRHPAHCSGTRCSGPGHHHSPSKSSVASVSSRPGTPNRKSITSIESKDHEKLVLAGARPLTKQATLMSLGKRGSGDKLREEGQRERAASASASTCSAPGPLSPKPVLKSSSASRAVGDIGSSATLKCTSSLRTTAEAASSTTTTTTTTTTVSATTKSSQAGSASTKSAVETESACPKKEVVETDSSGPHKEPVQISSPRPETSSVETNTEGGGSNMSTSRNTVITEVQTDANNAKVLLSKKTQTEITAVAVSQTDILPDDSFAEINTPSPRNKKKPLKKQRSLSKITNSFGKIVTLAYDFDAERS